MTYAVYDQYGDVISGGFKNKEQATAWLITFKKYAKVDIDNERVY